MCRSKRGRLQEAHGGLDVAGYGARVLGSGFWMLNDVASHCRGQVLGLGTERLGSPSVTWVSAITKRRTRKRKKMRKRKRKRTRRKSR